MVEDPESRDSVLDFIYVDSRRIALYLAQFSQYGNLTSLVHSVAKTDEDRLRLKAAIGPRSFRGEVGSDTGETANTGVQKTYNTQWIAPLSLLEELEDRNMIKRTFEDVRIGDIFILPGVLSLFDMGMWAKVWDVVAAQHEAKPKPPPGNRRHRRAAKALSASGVVVSEPEAVDAGGLRIMGALAQPTFVNFQSKGRHFWSLAESGGIVGDSLGLSLKCGVTIPGTWHLVGVLDAMPESDAVDDQWLTRLCGSSGNTLGSQIIGILGEFRAMLGRPAECYGVTPLAIFREVGQARI